MYKRIIVVVAIDLPTHVSRQRRRIGEQGSRHVPMTRLGRSMMSLRIEKQNVHGTGAPFGFSRTQCEYTDWVVFSNAWLAKFSQYSTTDWFSNSCGADGRRRSGPTV